MPTYRLHYFNFKGKAEIARILFAYAGVKYEDVRMEREEWQERKKTDPVGNIPYLEVDGQAFGQSAVIYRYLGKKFGLMGGDDEIRCMAIDEFVEDILECREAMATAYLGTEEARKLVVMKKLIEETIPKLLTKCEAKLDKNGTGWAVGDSLTLADIVLFDAFDMFIKGPPGDAILAKFPKIMAHRERVSSIPQIKEWIAVRPVSAM